MDRRIERDSLGEVRVPASAYYGVQTARAIENFPISGERPHPLLVRAYALIKKAAARAHREMGNLEPEKADAIIRAADEIARGALADHFVVDTYQAGAGTSTNMNVNEVIANRALELLGRSRGDYAAISPNDHVNRGQSTNDTFPTAVHLASLFALPPIYEAADELAGALDRKGEEFHDIVKSGRTHLQDAMPIRLGQEFRAYASAIRRARRGIARASEDLYEVALGGTAVGTGTNTPPGFRRLAVSILAEETKLPLRPASDPFEAIESRYASAHISGALRDLALELARIANDLRLLASGPTTGFAEIELPAVQPGSSIMPGKVNPVIPECVNMICFQAIGNDVAVVQAVAAGQLELNVMMPVIAATFLKTAGILSNGMQILARRCVAGIRADPERCRAYLEKNPSLATLLNPAIGYLRAAEVAKEALARGAAVRDIVREKGFLPPEEIDRLFSEAALLWEGEGRGGGDEGRGGEAAGR